MIFHRTLAAHYNKTDKKLLHTSLVKFKAIKIKASTATLKICRKIIRGIKKNRKYERRERGNSLVIRKIYDQHLGLPDSQ